MTRSELTVKAMEDRGLRPADIRYKLEDVVTNIKENPKWAKLRCRTDESKVYTGLHDRYEMCATYRVFYHREYLEVFLNDDWRPVAYRSIECGEQCIYAD